MERELIKRCYVQGHVLSLYLSLELRPIGQYIIQIDQFNILTGTKDKNSALDIYYAIKALDTKIKRS